MEIERKFLTEREKIPFDITAFPCMEITQAYIGFSPVIRIRRSNEAYILTVKGKGLLAREEFELPLEQEEYEALQKKAEGESIVKKRWLVPLAGGLTAEDRTGGISIAGGGGGICPAGMVRKGYQPRKAV